MGIGFKANRNKIGALLAYLSFMMPSVELRKLLKIIYLIDEKAVMERSFPITWLDYYAWAKGPVATDVYDIKNGTLSDFVVCKKNDSGKWSVSPVKHAEFPILQGMKAFSNYEKAIIDGIIAQYGNKSSDELTDVTHERNTLWYNVVNENGIDFTNQPKSNFLIDLNRLNDDNHKEIFEDAFDTVQIQAAINSI
ncbi:MAG: SocA family protein [Bacteroidales bacterium]|nr:SocA family protein [Bacteroidales bacterium]